MGTVIGRSMVVVGRESKKSFKSSIFAFAGTVGDCWGIWAGGTVGEGVELLVDSLETVNWISSSWERQPVVGMCCDGRVEEKEPISSTLGC